MSVVRVPSVVRGHRWVSQWVVPQGAVGETHASKAARAPVNPRGAGLGNAIRRNTPPEGLTNAPPAATVATK